MVADADEPGDLRIDSRYEVRTSDCGREQRCSSSPLDQLWVYRLDLHHWRCRERVTHNYRWIRLCGIRERHDLCVVRSDRGPTLDAFHREPYHGQPGLLRVP